MTEHSGHRDPNEVAEALSAYWDTLVGADAADDTRAPEGLVAMVDRLYASDVTPALLPKQRMDIWQAVMTAHGRDSSPHTIATDGPLGANGRSPGLPLPQRPSTPGLSPLSARPGWIVAQLATAALLMLALLGSFLAFGPGRMGRQPPAPALIPAIGATPTPPETDGVTTTPLLEVTIPVISGNAAFVAIERYTMPAATTLHADLHGGSVPAIFFVEEGALEIRAIDVPEPVRVIRAGGSVSNETIAHGQSSGLAAGDAVVIPENGDVDLMNLSPQRALVLYLLEPDNLMPPSADATVSFETLAGNARNLTAPLTLSLRLVTLAPEASLPGADDPRIEQIAIPVDPDRVMDARTTSNGSLRNAGDEPLAAYVLTVTSSAPDP
jgi:hypothetical protein